MKSGPDYYLCPFCVSSWVCHGPHIQSGDLPKYLKKLAYMQQDLAELSREIVLQHGDQLTTDELARLVEKKLLDRQSF